MTTTRLILVGGFLGAGKTTLLATASRLLVSRGETVGLITNDQAADLVDTSLLRHANRDVLEIAGGCFCCRFGDLITTARELVATISPSIIIGEPVGSCTDLSATVLQPIKDLYADRFRLAPMSVLVDPVRLREVLSQQAKGSMHSSAQYILRKQLEEADIVVVNKLDLVDAEERLLLADEMRSVFPDKPVQFLSALSGDGVEEWLDSVLAEGPSGKAIVDVDYDIYAEGEAVLGWLNSSATLNAVEPADWATFAFDVLGQIQMRAIEIAAPIAHVKLSLTSPAGQITANLTSSTNAPSARGSISDSASNVALVINARVEIDPDALILLVHSALNAAAGKTISVTEHTMRSLSPGHPVPTHRYTTVV